MKAVIVYYSLTGNTEKIAKAVRAGVEAECGACDLIKIKDANPRQLYKYDLIGIGSPIYLIEPENVRSLEEALSGLIVDPKKGVNMGQKGLQLVREKFDWESKVVEIERILNELA